MLPYSRTVFYLKSDINFVPHITKRSIKKYMYDSIIICLYLYLDICILISSIRIVSREFHNFGPSIEIYICFLVVPEALYKLNKIFIKKTRITTISYKCISIRYA